MLDIILSLIFTCVFALLISWAYHYYKVPANHKQTTELMLKFLKQKPLRISITASSSSGKSTLSKQLSQSYGIKHVEMDGYLYGPGWVRNSPQVVKSSIYNSLLIHENTYELSDTSVSWIADGNYSAIRDPIWQHAHVIIWLDYHSHVVYPRMFLRTLRRVIYKEVLWGNNVESFWGAFFSKESLLFLLWRTHKNRQITYRPMFQRPEFKSRVIHLESPEQTRQFVATLLASVEKSE